MKIVHCADVHLDSPLHGLERYEGAPLDEMRAATRRAFANVVDLCADEGATGLLLAGDLYDGDWRDFGTGLFFAAQMVRLRDLGVQVFVVRGNHDAASRITRSLRLPDNVRTFSSRRPETQVVEEIGLAVHGQSFPHGEVPDDLSARYPDPVPGLVNIGLLHTSADGRPGHDAYAPCTVSGLVAKRYHYWALGHVHAREVLHERPWIVFPGNLQGRHARETGPKGCTLVTVEDGKITRVEHRPLDVVRWAVVGIDATGCRTEADVLERIAEALRAIMREADGRVCAVRLEIRGECRAHEALANRRDAWIAEARATATDVGSGLVWLEKVMDATRPEVDVARLAAESGPLGELAKEIAGLRDDPARVEALAAALGDFGSRLPVEVREGPDAIRLDAEGVRAALADIESLLLPRLVGRGAGQ